MCIFHLVNEYLLTTFYGPGTVWILLVAGDYFSSLVFSSLLEGNIDSFSIGLSFQGCLRSYQP